MKSGVITTDAASDNQATLARFCRSCGVSNLINPPAALVIPPQRRAIVGDISFRMPHLLVRHGPQAIAVESDRIFKHRRQRMRQKAKDDDLLIFRHIEDDFRNIGRRPPRNTSRKRTKFGRRSDSDFG